MRIIKFRAWYEPGKNYVPEGGYLAPIYANKNVEDGYILEQFTGLLDKNGKEIYEGDIFRLCDGDFYETPPTVVELSDFLGGNYWLVNNGRENPEYEVIGNIHENPELLEANNGR